MRSKPSFDLPQHACQTPAPAFPALMPPSIFSVLRSGLILLSCATWMPLRADFELTGTLPARLATGPIIVRRESLETRNSLEVARTMPSKGNFTLSVPSGAGLFTVELGDLRSSFVAADGQTLTFSTTDDDKNLIIAGAPDQALFVAYEAPRAKSFARLVPPERDGFAAARRPVSPARRPASPQWCRGSGARRSRSAAGCWAARPAGTIARPRSRRPAARCRHPSSGQ